MHHHPLRRALGVEHVEHRGVGVPVVDDQRLVVGLGQCEVGGEGGALEPLTLGLRGPVVVEPGLPDRPYAGSPDQGFDLGQGRG